MFIKKLIFILKNKKIVFSNGIFSRKTNAIISCILTGIITKKINFTIDEEKLIIRSFLDGKQGFNINTPNFITNNRSCIKHAVKNDINSIYYIDEVDADIKKYIIDKCLEENYIIEKNTPVFLRCNYLVVKKSVMLDVSSADYILWESFTKETKEILVDEIISLGYILNAKSHSFLKKHEKVIIKSLEKDNNTINHVDEKIALSDNLFEKLALCNYPFKKSELRIKTLDCFQNFAVFKYGLYVLDFYGNNDAEYTKRFSKLLFDCIKSKPMIKTFNSLFDYAAEKEWIAYLNEKTDEYTNIYGKICSELRNSISVTMAFTNINFLYDMYNVLEGKADTLHYAMIEYFNIYHSDIDDKMKKIQASKNIISKLSSLYIAKSKEKYKKEKVEKYQNYIKKYFKLNIDSSYIKKTIFLVKRKEYFYNLYLKRDENTCNFIDKLIKIYSSIISEEIIRKFINDFLSNNNSNFDEIFIKPFMYDSYKRYKKAIKLINRLNSGYIMYDSIELIKYKDIIKYENNKYVYIGRSFSKFEIELCKEYELVMNIFDKIKKELMLKIKEINCDIQLDEKTIERLMLELPFTDDYFVFRREEIIKRIELFDLKRLCGDGVGFNIRSFNVDSSFDNVKNLLINNGLFWLLYFLENDFEFTLSSIYDKGGVYEVINKMEQITNLANTFNIDVNNYKNIVMMVDIIKHSDYQSLAILGQEIIYKLIHKRNYTNYNKENIIRMSKELICQMTKRHSSTVPYINGSYLNYKYSLYDSLDESILVSGIDTDSCFRIDGVDNDFFHYCALNKNGFVMKITDENDNFIAKASGFRNGNCVFINQLRTIYDLGGGYYIGMYQYEKKEIIDTFKKACEDIVKTSFQNGNEKLKIDHVFVTQSYFLEDYENNVSSDVEEKIGSFPVNMDSDDWRIFICDTLNLELTNIDDIFTTDYGNYPLICMASSKDVNSIERTDIKMIDVPALYERKRNKVIVTKNIDMVIYNKINKIKAINAFISDCEFVPISLEDSSIIFTGDNWYIIYNNGNIYDCCVIKDDRRALQEFNVTKEIVLKYRDKLEQTNLNNIEEEHNKILKLF